VDKTVKGFVKYVFERDKKYSRDTNHDLHTARIPVGVENDHKDSIIVWANLC